MKENPSKEIDSFIRQVPQIVPESWCLECKICCRFPETEGVQTPTWSSLEADWARKAGADSSWFLAIPESPSLAPQLHSCGSGYRCPAFQEEQNRCSIYRVRPLDCRLYPFVLTKDAAGTRALLAMDQKCPFIQAHGTDPDLIAYSQQLTRYLDSPLGLAYLKTNPHLIGPSWPEFVTVASLPGITATVQADGPVQAVPKPPHPILQLLTLENRPLLEEALAWKTHAHSSYTLAGLLGWSDLIRYWWAQLEGAFCLFAQQGGGVFMPLPPLPLGKTGSHHALEAAWEILTEANQAAEVSRVEGIEPSEIPFFKAGRFQIHSSEPEYLYRRADLAGLRGDRYRSQRWAVNRCLREISYRFRPYQEKDLIPCLQLYTQWGIQKQRATTEAFPKSLIRDGLFFHRRLMIHHKEFNLTGRVLEIDGRIRGYTFGAQVSPRVFCIFLEIADRSIPGLAQLLFREFCRELESFPLINAMGDSGIPGLKQAKESYHPVGSVTAVVARK